MTPTCHLVVREGAAGPYYEVKWVSQARRSEGGKPLQIKRRLGPAWLERDTEADPWRKRRGRPQEGYLDARAATVAAEAMMREVEAGFGEEAKERRRREAQPLTFREVAQAWLEDMATVRRAKPSTIKNYGYLLREPGEKYSRREGRAPGLVMAAFGAQDIRTISPKMVGDFIRSLDAEKTPRTVNAYRQVLSAVFSWACREDVHGLPSNPVAKVPKRREPPPAALAYYEVDEVEELARALADGLHRTPKPRGRAGKPLTLDENALAVRRAEDLRDADCVRLLFYTGMRLGEVRALTWSQVDLEGRAVLVTRNISAGQVVQTPKAGRARIVPLATPAVEVLQRQAAREDYRASDDLVFPDRFGGHLDDSALRRRFAAACDAIGLRRVRMHGLRHGAGSHFARQGSAAEVMGFLGHVELSTTSRYMGTRFSPDFLKRLDAGFNHSGSTDDIPAE